MAYRDLREWIDKLEAEEQLVRITAPVHWNGEIGAITRKVLAGGGPALLFENIEGYRDAPCSRLFTAGLGTFARTALMLGLPKDTHPRDQVRFVRQRLEEPVKPVVVETGPVKENVIRGDQIDLHQFPVPKWHHRDGGRYINTFCGVVTRDPDNGKLNIGIYRGMLAGKDKISVLLAPTQHWGHHFIKYRRMGKPMPVAIAYGWDPVLPFVASSPIPINVCEYDVMGAIRGEPVELVKCETNDLLVPASAEIVVEGHISTDPKTFEMEGPFGEFPGYYGGTRSPKPTIKVDCVTHRTNPILRAALEGASPGKISETVVMAAVGQSATSWQILDNAGVPGVVGAWMFPTTVPTIIQVQLRKMYRGHGKQAAAALWGCGYANWGYKYVVTVDEDIDIHNPEAILWAIAYRVNEANNDIVVFKSTIGSVLDPSVNVDDRDIIKYGSGTWNRVLFDATKDWNFEPREEWGGDRYPPLATDVDPEFDELTQRRWKEYGLP